MCHSYLCINTFFHMNMVPTIADTKMNLIINHHLSGCMCTLYVHNKPEATTLPTNFSNNNIANICFM